MSQIPCVFPESSCEGFFSNRTPTKIILITSPTSSSHHLTYITIIYANIIYINIIYLIIYITYIIYSNIIYTIYIIIYMYINYINIRYIIFQEFIRKRKTPIDSGVTTQETNSY